MLTARRNVVVSKHLAEAVVKAMMCPNILGLQLVPIKHLSCAEGFTRLLLVVSLQSDQIDLLD